MAELLEALSSSSETVEFAESSSSVSSMSDSSSASRSLPRDDVPDDERKRRRSTAALRSIPLTAPARTAGPRTSGVLPRARAGFFHAISVYVVLILETLGRRRFARVAEARMAGEKLVVEGQIPRQGGVVLAANHYPDAGCLGVVSAILEASRRGDDFEIVVGERARRPRGRLALLALLARPVVAVFRWMIARWSSSPGAGGEGRSLLVRVPTHNASPRVDALRTFRARAEKRCVLVFPEGRMQHDFAPVRPGAGRFLRSLDCPTIPVAVYRTEDAWHVHFGAPIRWTDDRALADQQLGLSIASLLPRELGRGWRKLLSRWRRAHASRADGALA